MKWVGLMFVLPLACTEQVRGIEMQIEVAAGTEGAALTSAGRPVTLEHAVLALGSVELLPCASSNGDLAPANLQLQHTEGSPTLLGSPAILHLSSASAGFTLGTLLPPAGRYCAVRQIFQPADDDAAQLHDPDDIGATLVARGTVDGAPFSLRTQATLQVDSPLDPPLVLDAEHPLATLAITLDRGVGWLENTSLQPGNETDDARAALGALQRAVSAQLE